MMDPLCITDPSQLKDITTKLAALDLTTEPRQITLVLFQPLDDPATLASCLPQEPAGTETWQYLNIQPLSQAWRKAIIEASPTPNLVFDLSLPQPNEISLSLNDWEAGSSAKKTRKICWDTSGSWDDNYILLTKDTFTMINSIALGVRMRVDGKVNFRVEYTEKEGLLKYAVDLLKKHLLATKKEYKETEKKEEESELYSTNQVDCVASKAENEKMYASR